MWGVKLVGVMGGRVDGWGLGTKVTQKLAPPPPLGNWIIGGRPSPAPKVTKVTFCTLKRSLGVNEGAKLRAHGARTFAIGHSSYASAATTPYAPRTLFR